MSAGLRIAVALAALSLGVIFTSAPDARAVDAPEASSRLERSMVDVRFLVPSEGSDAPGLLVIDEQRPSPSAVRVAVIRRDGVWMEQASAEIVLVPSDAGVSVPDAALETPWMLSLDVDSVALVANASSADAAYLTVVHVDTGAGHDRIAYSTPVRVPFHVDDAGLADIDGDGRPSLVLASALTKRADGTCRSTTIMALDPGSLAVEALTTLADIRIAGAVIGRFDDVPGDDLFAYAYPDCAASPDLAIEARITAFRLLDGSILFDQPAAVARGSLGAPMRLDAEGDGRHQLVARSAVGLALIAPVDGWAVRAFAPGSALPLIALGPDAGRGRGVVGWLDATGGDQRVSMATVGPDLDVSGSSFERLTMSSVQRLTIGSPRWERIIAATEGAAADGAPPVAFSGAVDPAGCADVFIPAAILPCGETTLRAGPSWIASRPLGLFGQGSGRRLLLAAGIEWDERLPAAPTPAASDIPGWWRHGPSVPFVLSEVRAADATYFRDFPIPHATIERVAGPGGTVDLPGFTGARLFVGVTGASADATEPVVTDDILRSAASSSERRLVARVAVPPGGESGRDGGFTRVDLGPSRVDEPGTGRWIVTVVPINEWGEVGVPAAALVGSDSTPPTLGVDAPFSTPLWPVEAEIPGVAEPGTTVFVDGRGRVDVDRRGRFAIRTTLAPWPQTFRISATDAAGNVTTREVTVVGGVDYRQFPWSAIATAVLLLAAGISGIVGSQRTRGSGTSGRASAGDGRWLDEGPQPEIEDLPPGTGALPLGTGALPRR